MKVLIVTQYFWPENFRINDLAQGLVKIGHDVTVLTGQPNYPSGRFFEGYRFGGRARETFQGIQVVRVPLLARGNGRTIRLLLNYLSFALFASLLGPLRCSGSADIILVYEPSPVTVGLPALVMKAVKKAPLMFWVQDLWPESLSATGAVRSLWILARVTGLVRFIYRGCDRVLVQSRAFVDRVRGLGVLPDRILYFPNSAEGLYRPVTREEVCSGEALPDGFRIMFAGNIGAAQSFATILSAAETLRDHHRIHWIILGEGRQSDWVRQEITRRRLERSVHMLGQHPMESMPEWFARADVLLVTLKSDPIFALTIPSKIQSYMACGRPILAALDGEGARVVKEACAGLVVSAEDAAALAEAVLHMSNMPLSEREMLGQNGRRYFLQEFDRDTLLARLDSWMKELVREESKCAS
ncbi:MAG: glycosyltransferase family 4 protein [Nitrospiraceae bacterium]|nr:glycosyltransferase family 4 protein [Nitrospiraceae bacterium]